ncbi:MAG TPA: MraY family glycosyltransferase [bacterium]|nr:MraY family glycosyltransferase [bacterium]
MSIPLAPSLTVGLVFLYARGPWHGGIYLQMYLFLIALLSAAWLTPVARRAAFRFGVVDRPNERKVHKVPTALLGGVAIFIAFTTAHFAHYHFTREILGIFAGAALLLVVGTIDDITGGISAKIRMIAQVLAALIVIHCGICLHFYPLTAWGRVISIFLTIFWIVGITNAVNFLDGMDGLATGISAVASGVFFVVSYRLNNPFLGFISVTLCGACLGFLLHNFKPADIFLGDGGSNVLGFTLASFGVMGDWSNGNPFISFSVPIMTLGIPIFDMVYTTIERFATGKVKTAGEWLAYTGKDHFHHRLKDHGFPDNRVVLFIYFVGIALGLNAIVIATSASTIEMALLLFQAASMFLIVTMLMSRAKRNKYEKPTISKAAPNPIEKDNAEDGG